MSNSFDNFVETNFLQAHRKYIKSDTHKTNEEKFKNMFDELQSQFNEDDYLYILRCIVITQVCDDDREKFMYRQGFEDCIQMLKKLSQL